MKVWAFILAQIDWTLAIYLLEPLSIDAVDISKALDCLHLTRPDLRLRYPSDAEEHLEEIRRAMPWRPTGARGWSYHAEDVWMTDIMARWDNRSKGTRAADLFGPYIPIFAYFVQPWFENKMRYPSGMMEALRGVLRHDVPYVVMSQNDEGLAGHRGKEFNLSEYPNILVLSGGGYGNVAIPLFNTQGRDVATARHSATLSLSANFSRTSASLRPYLVNFVGTIGHAPWHLRERMREAVANFSVAHNISDQVIVYQGRDWREVMLKSKFSLVPRGYGRTSYHLVETIHAGLIPIHIFSDVPWVPYPELFNEFGFVTDIKGLPALLERLRAMSPSEIDTRESVVVKYAHSHFTPQALIEQVLDFLLWRNGGGDLRCQRLPPTVRDGDFPGEAAKPVSGATAKA